MNLLERELLLETDRLVLEPVTEKHFQELWQVYSDPELHAYVPPQPKTYEENLERFSRWSKRISPKGDEVLLNWCARSKSVQTIIGHFQAQIKPGENASVGYIIKKSAQRKGFAFEGLLKIFDFLRSRLNAQEIKAWVDIRNEASIQLAKKLGMDQTELVKGYLNKDGIAVDDFVFTLKKS